MKVIIAGGRDFDPANYEALVKLNELNKQYGFTEIVSGKCSGADKLGEDWAKMNKLPIKDMPADWNDLTPPCIIGYRYGKPYNALAGPKRNEQMAQYADAVILFKGNKGTNNMRKLAHKYNLSILYDMNYPEAIHAD